MNKADKLFYTNLLRIKYDGYSTEGDVRPVLSDGTKAQSRYITNIMEEYDLEKGQFPITTVRPIAWKTAIRELFVIYVDQKHTQKAFHDRGIKYWDDWMFDMSYCKDGSYPVTDENGDIIKWGGRRYGETVAKYKIIDKVLEGLAENPFNRRSIINLWQYSDFEETEGLVPCAYNFMVDVRKVGNEFYLDGTLIQRSNDIAVAGAINKIQYTVLQMMIACHFGWKVGKFNHYVMNLHYYDNQQEQIDELIGRYIAFDEYCISSNLYSDFDGRGEFRQCNIELARDVFNEESWANQMYESPELKLTCPPGTNFYDIKPEDFVMENYHPDKRQLKFELAI